MSGDGLLFTLWVAAAVFAAGTLALNFFVDH